MYQWYNSVGDSPNICSCPERASGRLRSESPEVYCGGENKPVHQGGEGEWYFEGAWLSAKDGGLLEDVQYGQQGNHQQDDGKI